MKAYLISVVLISAIVSLASHFLGGTEAARYGRLGLSVVLLWAVIAPLSELCRALPEIPDFSVPSVEEGMDAPLYAARAEAAFCDGIAAAIAEKFSLQKAQVSVISEDFDLLTVRAARVRVLLKKEAIFADSFAIAAFVEGEGLGECEVEIEIGST